ncbi:MAG: alpha/beta hydrolase [Burkholderiales bacterium]|nr:MAG: alpha/beta hydrolase [Burkholderiales bacterium]
MKGLALTMAMILATGGLAGATAPAAFAQDMSNGANNFYKSDAVDVQKVTFKNKLGMKVVGNLYTPKSLDRTKATSAIVVGHPMGAVKEQSSNLYAQKLAEQGFVALSFDLSYWGESEGEPRHTVVPDIYVDAFSAAVDFLSTQAFVDKDKIGVLGICGSGSFSIAAAKIDPRLKAIATVSMYDMGAASRDGLRKGVTLDQRHAAQKTAIEQRFAEFTGGPIQHTGGTVNELKADSNAIEREFYDFYRTPRGQFTPEGDNSIVTTKPTLSSNTAFNNFYPFTHIETIAPRPMLFIAGEEAHSIEFSQEAYKLAGEPKELVIVPNAGHVDLYDRVNLIPFDKLGAFFKKNLGAPAA